MNFLKNLALGLLSFLLFLSLSTFASALMLNKTLLNPEFVTAELNRLDISSLAGELLRIQPVPPEAPYINKVINETFTDLEPWLKQEMNAAIYSAYDYLLGKSESLSLIISTEAVRDSLRENLMEAFLASLPPELEGLPAFVKEQYFDDFYHQLAEAIPPTIEFSQSSLSPDALAMLEQVKQSIVYFQLVYKYLPGFMVLLVLGIIAISRQVKDITRRLGIPCLTYGAFGYASVFLSRYLAGTRLSLPELPASLQAWLPQFIDNLLAPLETFNLALLITGIVLVIVSLVYKPRQPSP